MLPDVSTRLFIHNPTAKATYILEVRPAPDGSFTTVMTLPTMAVIETHHPAGTPWLPLFAEIQATAAHPPPRASRGDDPHGWLQRHTDRARFAAPHGRETSATG